MLLVKLKKTQNKLFCIIINKIPPDIAKERGFANALWRCPGEREDENC